MIRSRVGTYNINKTVSQSKPILEPVNYLFICLLLCPLGSLHLLISEKNSNTIIVIKKKKRWFDKSPF